MRAVVYEGKQVWEWCHILDFVLGYLKCFWEINVDLSSDLWPRMKIQASSCKHGDR